MPQVSLTKVSKALRAACQKDDISGALLNAERLGAATRGEQPEGETLREFLCLLVRRGRVVDATSFLTVQRERLGVRARALQPAQVEEGLQQVLREQTSARLRLTLATLGRLCEWGEAVLGQPTEAATLSLSTPTTLPPPIASIPKLLLKIADHFSHLLCGSFKLLCIFIIKGFYQHNAVCDTFIQGSRY